MNSGSEKKLSMDELMARNRPAPTAQQTVQEQTPLPEAHPTQEEWVEMVESICTLTRHVERQSVYLKKVSELLAQLPSQAQMDELLKEVKYLEQMAEQAGKQKEKRFSLPRIRLPRLSLPDIPWTSLMLGLAALALTGLVLWVVWSSLATLWSVARGLLP